MTWALTTQSYFFADDLLLADYFSRTPLTVEVLTRSWFGHLMPGYILSDATFLNSFGLSWPAASVLIAAIHTGAFVALVRCLDATIGRLRLNLLAGFGFTLSIALMATRLWWAASLNNVVALALCLSTLGCLSRWLRRRTVRALVATWLTYALAVFSSEKSLLFSAFAVLWCVLVIWRDRPIAERMRDLLRCWQVWLGITAIALVDVIAFLTGPYVQESGETASFGFSALFIGWGVTGGLIPSLFGIDLWLIDPVWAPLAVVVSCAVVLVLAIRTLRLHRRLAGVWLFALLGVLVNQAVLSRRAGLLDIDGGRILRYHIENTALVWMSGEGNAYAALWGPGRAGPIPPGDAEPTGDPGRLAAARSTPQAAGRRSRIVAAVAVLICVGLWVQSLVRTIQVNPGYEARQWVERLSQTWPTASSPQFLRFPLPGGFALAAMYPYNMSDRVLPLLHPEVRFSDQLAESLVIGVDGSAGPARFVPVQSVDVNSCLQSDQSVAAAGIDVTPGSFVEISYQTDAAGLLITAQGQLGELVIGPGSGSVIQYQPFGLPTGSLSVTSRGTAVCISSVGVGYIVPNQP